MIDRKQAIEVLKQHHDPERECEWIVDAILALPDPAVERLQGRLACIHEAVEGEFLDRAERAEAELALMRPVVEAAREAIEVVEREFPTAYEADVAHWRSVLAALDEGKPVTDEMVERAAKVLAGPPRCYCPDDWRQAYDKARCPQHGDSPWPRERHRREARAALLAALDGER